MNKSAVYPPSLQSQVAAAQTALDSVDAMMAEAQAAAESAAAAGGVAFPQRAYYSILYFD